MSLTQSNDPPKRELTKAENRRVILDAARDVFAQQGQDAVSVRDIIRATPLASGTFYNYFRSKAEVMDALADESLARFRPRLRAVREESTDVPDFIAGAYLAFFEFLCEESQRLRSAKSTSLTALRMDTPANEAIFGEIRADVRRALERGALADDTDIDFCAAMCIGMARDVGERMLRRHPQDPEAAARFCASMVLNALKL